MTPKRAVPHAVVVGVPKGKVLLVNGERRQLPCRVSASDVLSVCWPSQVPDVNREAA